MSNAIEQYVIRYLSGSKMNQEERFDYDKPELSIGRTPGSEIQFDAQQDLIVSREHGKIIRESSNPPSFVIVDNNSRNGIFVNNTRVKGTANLHPGDEVQLGNNGPVFVFDVNPRPVDMLMATKIVEIPSSVRPALTKTMEQPQPEAAPLKTGLGKQTVERMLQAERTKSFKILTMVLGGAIVLLGLLGYAIRGRLFGDETKIPADTVQIMKKSPAQISRENENKVVQIEYGWKIFDIGTNEELVHLFRPVLNVAGVPIAYRPMYIRNNEGKIEPFLELKRNIHYPWNGTPIGIARATGTGFVISPDGFIFTNRHIGTGWNTMYTHNLAFPGVLVDRQRRIIAGIKSVTPEDVGIWVPVRARMISGTDVGPGQIHGENTFMNVVFAGTSLRRPVNSRSVTPSNNHDVALIKVEIPESLAEVSIRENNSNIEAGQPVTVMGYPGIAPQPYDIQQSNDVFNPSAEPASRPTPTVTPGSIGRIVPASSVKDNLFSWMGDLYQLTINATGSGNSGGPLFDEEGQVIGIFSSGMVDSDGTKITFAVPIKYGLELLGPKKVKAGE